MSSKDLLHLSAADDQATHKKKRLISTPNSAVLQVECPSCKTVSKIYSHAATAITCSCGNLLASPTGGRIKLQPKLRFRGVAN